MRASRDRGRQDGYRPTDPAVAHDDVTTGHDRDGIDDRGEMSHRDPVHRDTVHPQEPRDAQRDVVAREKAKYGGIKWGSAFFGWLTAVGTTVLLTALVAGTGTALGLASDRAPVDQAARDASTVGIIGAVILALVIFIAYYAGGYVAGRMARLDGAKQGLAVWLWAIVVAIVVAIIGAIGGAQFTVLAALNGFPGLPIGEGELTTIGIVTAVIVVLVSLGGAILGGLAGMRYHRRIDRAGLGIDAV
jgi:hypothetical protein